jgi:hypothetical protein
LIFEVVIGRGRGTLPPLVAPGGEDWAAGHFLRSSGMQSVSGAVVMEKGGMMPARLYLEMSNSR